MPDWLKDFLQGAEAASSQQDSRIDIFGTPNSGLSHRSLSKSPPGGKTDKTSEPDLTICNSEDFFRRVSSEKNSPKLHETDETYPTAGVFQDNNERLLSKSEKTAHSENPENRTGKTDKTYPITSETISEERLEGELTAPPRADHYTLVEAAMRSRPDDVAGAQRRVAVRGLRAFLAAGHGAEAERLGWPRDELYHVPELWSQIRLCGVGLLIGDRGVTEVTAAEIRVKTASGATLAFYRKPAVDYRLVYETRLKLLRGNYADGSSEEPRLRAFEHAIRFCCDHHNCDLETAKRMVMAALKAVP